MVFRWSPMRFAKVPNVSRTRANRSQKRMFSLKDWEAIPFNYCMVSIYSNTLNIERAFRIEVLLKVFCSRNPIGQIFLGLKQKACNVIPWIWAPCLFSHNLKRGGLSQPLQSLSRGKLFNLQIPKSDFSAVSLKLNRATFGH